MTSTEVRGTGRSRAPEGDDPVLLSKITTPGLPGWVVARPRVDKLITGGARGPLTTVTGPPGAGKSMAIALWAAARAEPGPLVWLTVDGYDNRPRVFWSYVMAALRRQGVVMPRAARSHARAGDVDHVFLLRLASVLAAQKPPVVMVLDDLHLVTEPATLDGLAYVLRNARPGLRLVVSSRMDPLLPLHRYRLTGELTEIRADDLAFSVPEAAALLSHHRVVLPAAALGALTGRTEGWAAGLRLAALSLDGHPDPEQFVKELAAEDSAITGYLVDEVLNAQPHAVRDLLLRTSILDCVNEDLAAEVAGDRQAAAALPALARANAFVRPLGRGWYRYHSMFAAVLRLKLRSECRVRLPDLRRRAAQWYQRAGQLTEAVRYAADSDDWTFATGMIVDELAIDQLIEPQDGQPLAEVFRSMPQHLDWTQPQPLLVTAAMELSDSAGDPGTVSDLGTTALAAAEAALDQIPAGEQVPARLTAALIRLALARRTGDLAAGVTAVARAEAWLGQLPESLQARVRAQVLSSRGAVELRAGRLDDAAASFSAAIAAAAAPDAATTRADCLGYLALLEVLRGRLSRAVELADDAAKAAECGSDGIAPHIAAAASAALASVHLERNEMQQVHSQLRLVDTALRASPDKLLSAVAWEIAARRRLAAARPAAALEMISRARQGWSPPAWLELRLSLLESRACTAAGNVQAAVTAAGRVGRQSASEAVAAVASAWLADGDHPSARRALDTLAEDSGELPGQLDLARWLVDARLSYEAGDRSRGRRSLERALQLAGPEQLRLPFFMERSWLLPVLRRDPELAHIYRELLQLEPGPVAPRPAGGPPRPEAAGQTAPLIVDRLSEREQEVLRHLSQMLSTAEIASEMYISVNTVKTHLRSIYRKLSAAHRSEAVRRARQLELI